MSLTAPPAGSGPGSLVASRFGRLVHKIDFERVLAAPTWSRSAHFAVHHLAGAASVPIWRHRPAEPAELSTAHAPGLAQPVDDLLALRWLGTVVPKRHAKRSVTRSLLKRQIRAAMRQQQGGLPPGLWVVRLRAPFAAAQFPSAASAALRAAADAELEQLLARQRR